MKTIFTISKTATTVFGILLVVTAHAQTSYQVAVTNNVFTPSELTIDVGDTVVWTNTQGTHNVNGNQSVFSSNPESFGNSLGVGWTYSYVFNTPGVYDYQCDPHVNFGMVGTVTVESTTSLATKTNLKTEVYPNPASDHLFISFDGPVTGSVYIGIYTLAGNKVKEEYFPGTEQIKVPLHSMKNGVYFVRIESNKLVATRKFTKY